jgi:predicted secreted hydrolase
MSANFNISRRTFAGGLALLGLGRKQAIAQGFAGLGESAEGFAPVVPGKTFVFPADHGPHRIFASSGGM